MKNFYFVLLSLVSSWMYSNQAVISSSLHELFADELQNNIATSLVDIKNIAGSGFESQPLQQLYDDKIESVVFNFEDIDLKNVADYIERIHNVKFVTDDIFTDNKKSQKLAGNKITFRTHSPLTKKESWNLFIKFLSMAGLDIVPMSQARFYKIIPLPDALKEPIPVYIGVDHTLLPDNDMFVRYVYFMESGDPVKVQPLISKFQASTGSLLVNGDPRALIFTDKSYNIKSLMTIVKELDKKNVSQAMSVIKLKYASIDDVISLYNSFKDSSKNSQQMIQSAGKDPVTSIFSKDIILSGDKRTNNLIMLGQQDALRRFEDFIVQYIDVPASKVKPSIYVYYLKNTQAYDMQAVLSDLVQYGTNTTAGQYGGVRGGQKYLRPMTIVADERANALIINASQEDYATVENLIVELDVPQKQIALEVLIVQVVGTKSKILGSQISGPNNNNTFLKSVSGQTSGIPPATPIITTAATTASDIAQSIKSGLSSLLLGSVGFSGSTVLTFGQPIWAVFKVLQTITDTKILQNPFLVVSNNSKGVIKIGTSRRVLEGVAVTQDGGDIASGYQQADAFMTLAIVAQVNKDNMINLGISIENEQFVNLDVINDAVTDSKSVATLASLADGEVLVLGGIMTDKASKTTHGVPLLSRIPILGWLFKSKSTVDEKNMFMVFICPKILDYADPQKIKDYANSKIKEAQHYLASTDDESQTAYASNDPLDRLLYHQGKKELKNAEICAPFDIDAFDSRNCKRSKKKLGIKNQIN